MNKSLYQIFGVPKNATSSAIDEAYGRLRAAYFARQQQGDTNATNELIGLTGAYEILGNSEKRTAYDEQLAARQFQPRPIETARPIAKTPLRTATASASKVAPAKKGINFLLMLLVIVVIAVVTVAAVRWKSSQKEQAQIEKQRHTEEQKNEQKKEYHKAMSSLAEIYVRWNDALRLADSTARIALSGPVGSLQGIKREAESLAVPVCLVEPKTKMVAGMDKFVNGLMHFMAYSSDKLDYVARERFEEGMTQFAEYEKDATACNPKNSVAPQPRLVKRSAALPSCRHALRTAQLGAGPRSTASTRATRVFG